MLRAPSRSWTSQLREIRAGERSQMEARSPDASRCLILVSHRLPARAAPGANRGCSRLSARRRTHGGLGGRTRPTRLRQRRRRLLRPPRDPMALLRRARIRPAPNDTAGTLNVATWRVPAGTPPTRQASATPLSARFVSPRGRLRPRCSITATRSSGWGSPRRARRRWIKVPPLASADARSIARGKFVWCS